MTISQVIFEEIADSYLVSGDLVCSYSLTPGLEPGHGDRVGLYRLPFLQVDFCRIKTFKFSVAAPRKCLLRLGRSWSRPPTQRYLPSFAAAQAGGLLPVSIPQVNGHPDIASK